jgi:signal transduction histidine kinase
VRGVPRSVSELGETAIPTFSLGSKQDQLQFDFVSINFRPAEKRRYQYRLEGADTDWHTTESTSVNYASLNPGSYRFLVRAVDSAGVPSDEPASASFTIRPPYWATAWFRVAAVLLGAGILYGIYRLRLQGETARVRLRYQERLDERARIARELHDTLLQSLAGVSLQLDSVAKQAGPDTEAVAARIRTVRQQVDASFREARHKVQDLRSPMLEGRSLPEVLRESLERIAVGHRVTPRVKVAGAVRTLSPELDEAVLRIGEEAVANAVRHAEASEIEARLIYGEASIRLCVRDNGRGFDPDSALHLDSHWGLKNMQERTDRIGGKWKLTTAAGRGTEIEAIFPLADG